MKLKNSFANWYLQNKAQNPDEVFLTADLGFGALEPIQKAMGSRFINVGSSEQNMIGVAAGLAKSGFSVTAYSMVPFLTLRTAEQIRNDLCFNNLNVKLIGVGAGYAYGIMGPSHQSIEDLSMLSSFPNMNCVIPVFDEDVASSAQAMYEQVGPSYLRLTNTPNIKNIPQQKFLPIRKWLNGDKITVLALGPSMERACRAIKDSDLEGQVDLYSVSQMPLKFLSEELLISLNKTKKVLCIEEHVLSGGLASQVSLLLHKYRINVEFETLHATKYPDYKLGNHEFLLKEFGLDSHGIQNRIIECLK